MTCAGRFKHCRPTTRAQAKLKEALAAQPATVDSRELAKAQEQIQSLMKENELLKTGRAQKITDMSRPRGTAGAGSSR